MGTVVFSPIKAALTEQCVIAQESYLTLSIGPSAPEELISGLSRNEKSRARRLFFCLQFCRDGFRRLTRFGTVAFLKISFGVIAVDLLGLSVQIFCPGENGREEQ
jgi:hypothetical protein